MLEQVKYFVEEPDRIRHRERLELRYCCCRLKPQTTKRSFRTVTFGRVQPGRHQRHLVTLGNTCCMSLLSCFRLASASAALVMLTLFVCKISDPRPLDDDVLAATNSAEGSALWKHLTESDYAHYVRAQHRVRRTCSQLHIQQLNVNQVLAHDFDNTY